MNVKEISADKIAYCIYTHNIETDKIPENRLRSVTKELQKLKIQDEKIREREHIELALAIYEHIGNDTIFGKYTDKIIDYYLDPDLFETSVEATIAVSELQSLLHHEFTKTEEFQHIYKNTDIYSRDIQRMKNAMSKVKQQYIRLGGLKSVFEKNIAQIPIPTLGTLQEDIYTQRESIKEMFASMGVSTTRAKKIAEEITKEAYQLLQ